MLLHLPASACVRVNGAELHCSCCAMHTKSMNAWTNMHNACSSMNSETHSHMHLQARASMCAHTHIYRDTHTGTHTHIRTHAHTHTLLNARTNTNINPQMHHICTDKHTHRPPPLLRMNPPPSLPSPPPPSFWLPHHTRTHIPAKGTIGVDQSQRIKGGIHCLSRGKQVGHNRNAQVGNQQSQADVEHSSYVITCHAPQQQVVR